MTELDLYWRTDELGGWVRLLVASIFGTWITVERAFDQIYGREVLQLWKWEEVDRVPSAHFRGIMQTDGFPILLRDGHPAAPSRMSPSSSPIGPCG